MPFSRYMELCLYHSELGYYSRAQEQFGKAGDFYTSSDVHAVFGRLLARQFEEMWRAARFARAHRPDRTRPRPRPLRLRCARLVAKQFPEFREGLALHPGRAIAVSSRTPAATPCRPHGEGTAAIFDTLEAASSSAGDYAHRFRATSSSTHFRSRSSTIAARFGSPRVDGKFAEQFVPPSPAELEFLDRYSVHPEAGRASRSVASRRSTGCTASRQHFAGRSGFAVLSTTATPASSNLPAAIATP